MASCCAHYLLEQLYIFLTSPTKTQYLEIDVVQQHFFSHIHFAYFLAKYIRVCKSLFIFFDLEIMSL